MKQLSVRGNLIGFAICSIAMTWFASVVVHWWLTDPHRPTSRLVVISLVWLSTISLSIPVFAALAVRQVAVRRKLRQKTAQRQSELNEIQQKTRQVLAEADERCAQNQRSLDDLERRRAIRNYFRS